MKQSYQTSTGQKVHAILAYHRLTAFGPRGEVTFFIPQNLRGEARCTIRRKNWSRMEALLDELEALQ